MNSIELNAAIDRFENKELGAGAATDEIQRAEASLGVAFPASYRAFLRHFGWVRLAHEEVCGLGHDLPEYRDVVKNTEFEREANPLLPATLVTLMADGAGNHYCLDTASITSNDECAIVFWDHERMQSEPVADGFVPWMRERLRQLSLPPDTSWRE